MTRFFLLIFFAFAHCVFAQETATPAPTVVARSSNSDVFRQQLKARVGEALGKRKQRFDSPFHFVFLVQVARYSQSDPRLSDLQSGLQAFIERDLLASRRTQSPAQVADTVSLVRYHFNAPIQNASGEPNPIAKPVWNLPLRDFLGDAAPLKRKFTFDALPDRFGDGQLYLDGHDWRRALMGAVAELGKQPMRLSNAVFIVIDWNSLSQSPVVRATGQRVAKADDKFLVAPQNPALYSSFKDAMTKAGLSDAAEGDGLETVQVGPLEYAMNVFTSSDLTPIASETPAPPTTKTTKPQPVESGGSAWPLLLFALPLGAFLFLGLRPTRLRLNESKVVSLSFLRAREVAILGTNGKAPAKGEHIAFSLAGAPTSTLATLRVNLRGQVSAHDGSYSVANVSGFAPSGNGLLLGGATGQIDIKPRGGGPGARLSVKKVA